MQRALRLERLDSLKEDPASRGKTHPRKHLLNYTLQSYPYREHFFDAIHGVLISFLKGIRVLFITASSKFYVFVN